MQMSEGRAHSGPLLGLLRDLLPPLAGCLPRQVLEDQHIVLTIMKDAPGSDVRDSQLRQ